MANHAHSTRTPLLPLAGALPPLLPRGAGRQLGPVTRALRVMQGAMTIPPTIGPVTDAIRVMRACDPDFAQSETMRALRRALATRIAGDIDVLDMLGGDPDLEPENEHGGDIVDEPHDAEGDDDRDSGCSDHEGAVQAYGGNFAGYAGEYA